MNAGPDHAETSTVAERVALVGFDYEMQLKEHVSACGLCTTFGRPVEVARQDRYGYRATLVVCGRCGLGYLSPRLTAAGYEHFYSGVYRPLVSAYHGRQINAQTVQSEQRDYAEALAAFLAPLLPSPPTTLVDVGGSTGVVAGVLAARLGARPTVLDPAPEELAVARVAGMETVAGFAEDFDPGKRAWDLVLLCQTIDHLLDVRATLVTLRQMTTAAGRAFVDILDVGFVLRRAGSIEAAVKIDHPYYLTRRTAVALFSLAGFEVVAERLSNDGHHGFLLSPGLVTEPDWSGLEASASDFLDAAWALRAVPATAR